MIKKSNSLRRNIFEIFLYAFLYGLVSINYIDFAPHHPVIGNWYHLWLLGQYFVPFMIILFIYGIYEWEIVGALGLSVSLMNDLFYAPMGYIWGIWKGNMLSWYLWQLGFDWLNAKWIFQGGFFSVRVTSILMGLSIYIRILIVVLLVWKWIYHD